MEPENLLIILKTIQSFSASGSWKRKISVLKMYCIRQDCWQKAYQHLNLRNSHHDGTSGALNSFLELCIWENPVALEYINGENKAFKLKRGIYGLEHGTKKLMIIWLILAIKNLSMNLVCLQSLETMFNL